MPDNLFTVGQRVMHNGYAATVLRVGRYSDTGAVQIKHDKALLHTDTRACFLKPL